MYLNEITLKSGSTITFTTTVPYSADKMEPGLNMVAAENGVTVTFVAEEVAAIINSKYEPGATTGKHTRVGKVRVNK